MKKYISVLLALVMVLSLGTVAFADGPNETDTITAVVDTVADENDNGVKENEASFDVKTKANVQTGDNYADIKYSVEVEWTVTGDAIDVLTGGLYEWDPTNLEYVKNEEKDALALGTNNSVDVTIKFTNSSNAAVNYEIVYADNDAEGDVLTTSEAANEGSSATGTVENADQQTGVATAADAKTGHDFTINATSAASQIGGKQPTTAEYKGTVTIEKIADGATIANNAELVLGTYTVTLSAYEAPAPDEESAAE